MNKELLRRVIFQIGESIDISGYIFPRRLVSELDLLKIRTSSLHKNYSPYQERFEKLLKIPKDDYVREFPLLIDNHDLWIKCINDCNADVSIYGSTRYFMADYFFPKAGMVVEIDSKYHISRKNYDAARDMYINLNYGLLTLRSDISGVSESFVANVENYYSLGLDIFRNPIAIDNSNYAANLWISKNEGMAELFSILESRGFVWQIELTVDEIYEMTSGHLNIATDDYRIYVETMWRLIYGRILHIS